MSGPFALRIERGARQGATLPLTAGGLTLGRQPGNDLVLDDPGVSRQHARIEERDGIVTVIDLGAANGTTVNGARIGGATTLQPGDTIGIGATTLRLVPRDTPRPPRPTTGSNGRNKPLLIGAIGALALLLCVCGSASLALIVGTRDGTPTPALALASTASVTPTPEGPLVPTATPGQAVAPLPTAVAAPAFAPTVAAQRPTPTPFRAAPPTATVKPPAPSARPVSNAGGSYSGKVQRGYAITFRVSPDGRTISEVRARALTDCGTGRSSDTTFAPDATFAVEPDGSFAGQGEYQPGFRYEFAGQLSGTSATGYLRDYSVVAGAVCDTRRLEWTAERQAQ